MSADGQRAMRSDAQRNRRRLLEVALEHFERDGFDASLEGIAEAAGVGIATLYRHFPSREALVGALAEDKLAEIGTATAASLEGDPDPVDALTAMVRDGARRHVEDRSLAELWRTVPDAEITAAARRVGLYRDTERLLAKAKATGRLRGDLEVADVVRIFYAVSGIVEAGHGDAVDRFVDLVLDGLLARDPAAPGPA
jgi:AcrR family transcriptional regulator